MEEVCQLTSVQFSVCQTDSPPRKINPDFPQRNLCQIDAELVWHRRRILTWQVLTLAVLGSSGRKTFKGLLVHSSAEGWTAQISPWEHWNMGGSWERADCTLGIGRRKVPTDRVEAVPPAAVWPDTLPAVGWINWCPGLWTCEDTFIVW